MSTSYNSTAFQEDGSLKHCLQCCLNGHHASSITLSLFAAWTNICWSISVPRGGQNMTCCRPLSACVMGPLAFKPPYPSFFILPLNPVLKHRCVIHGFPKPDNIPSRRLLFSKLFWLNEAWQQNVIRRQA